MSKALLKVRHFITEGYQVDQAGLPLGESMLTIPDDFLVTHMPGNYFQDYQFHHLLRNQGEAD